jgi:PAS domain S-box-containing protein
MAIADLEGRLLFANQAWVQMHGYKSKGELIGRHLKIFHSQEQLERDVIPFNQKVVENGFNTGEVGHIRKDGTPFPTLMTTTLLRDEAGKPIGLAGITHDITERKKAEEKLEKLTEDLQTAKNDLEVKVTERTKELRKAYDDLREADKVKDDFLAITSHELKTPLTSIIGLTQLLQEELADKMSDDEKEDVKVVLEEANRLKKLIEEILELARLDAGKQVFNMVELDVKKIADEVADELKAFSEQNQVTVNVEEVNVPAVKGDYESIKRLFNNLINNAVKYSSEKQGTITVGAYQDKDTVVTYVRDNGIGIPNKAKTRIFDRFYQVDSSTSRKYGGTGLGLTICKKIVEAHNGRIWFDSKLGQGTTFYFSLPIFNKTK